MTPDPLDRLLDRADTETSGAWRDCAAELIEVAKTARRATPLTHRECACLDCRCAKALAVLDEKLMGNS